MLAKIHTNVPSQTGPRMFYRGMKESPKITF